MRRAVDAVEEGGSRAVDREHALLDPDVAEARADVAAEERCEPEGLGDVDPAEGAPARKGDREPPGLRRPCLDGSMLVRRDVHLEGTPADEDHEQAQVGAGEGERRPTPSPARPEGEQRADRPDEARRGEEREAAEPAHARHRQRAARAGADQVGEVEPVDGCREGGEGRRDRQAEEKEGRGQEAVDDEQQREPAERAEELRGRHVDRVDGEEGGERGGRERDAAARHPAESGGRGRRWREREQRPRGAVAQEGDPDHGVDEDRVVHHRDELHEGDFEVD